MNPKREIHEPQEPPLAFLRHHRVGVFDLPEGSRVVITVGNEGTDGYVVADGVYLVPEEE